MTFKELFHIFSNNCGLELSIAYKFIAMINILLNSDDECKEGNPFSNLLPKNNDENIPGRFYIQFNSDNGYHKSKFQAVLTNDGVNNISTFIDGLEGTRKESINCEIKDKISLYRDKVVDGRKVGEYTVGEGFAVLLNKFIEQRAHNKIDPGISSFFPYDTEIQAKIAELSKGEESNTLNVFILPPGGCKENQITLSMINSPRVDLCAPTLIKMDVEEWKKNLSKAKGLALFFEAQQLDKDEQGIFSIRMNSSADLYAYIGYIEEEPYCINDEDVKIAYTKVGRILVQNLYANRNVLGITGKTLQQFFFGCHEGRAVNNDWFDCDGYWVPEDWELQEGNSIRIEIDEFALPGIALPMWIIKSVNLTESLRKSKINVEPCE